MRTKRRPTARRTRRTPSATARFLHDRYIGDDPRQQAVYEAHLGNAAIARQIYDLRMKAGGTRCNVATDRQPPSFRGDFRTTGGECDQPPEMGDRIVTVSLSRSNVGVSQRT